MQQVLEEIGSKPQLYEVKKMLWDILLKCAFSNTDIHSYLTQIYGTKESNDLYFRAMRLSVLSYYILRP